MDSGLRLIAQDEEDLKILSAHLQNAQSRMADMAYLPKARRFALVLARRCWEDCGAGVEPGTSVTTGLHFDGVLHVQVQSMPEQGDDTEVELLGVVFIAGKEGAGVIDLLFRHGGRIRLDVECIEASLRDLEEEAQP